MDLLSLITPSRRCPTVMPSAHLPGRSRFCQVVDEHWAVQWHFRISHQIVIEIQATQKSRDDCKSAWTKSKSLELVGLDLVLPENNRFLILPLAVSWAFYRLITGMELVKGHVISPANKLKTNTWLLFGWLIGLVFEDKILLCSLTWPEI